MTTTERPFGLSRDDSALIISLACSLDEKPGSNWVQAGGGLPDYICEVARAIKKTGKDTSTAIAMAVSRVKRWAATGKGETKAKAAKAIAQWEALKAKGGKRKSATVKASHSPAQASEVLVMLSKATTSTPDYSLDSIRAAWDSQRSQARRARRKADPTTWTDTEAPYEYAYVKEVWNRWLIVRAGDSEERYFRVPYSVASDGEVSFGTPSEVKQSYVDVVTPSDTDGSLDDLTLLTAMALSTEDTCTASPLPDLGPLSQSHVKSLVELNGFVARVVPPTSWVTDVARWRDGL